MKSLALPLKIAEQHTNSLRYVSSLWVGFSSCSSERSVSHGHFAWMGKEPMPHARGYCICVKISNQSIDMHNINVNRPVLYRDRKIVCPLQPFDKLQTGVCGPLGNQMFDRLTALFETHLLVSLMYSFHARVTSMLNIYDRTKSRRCPLWIYMSKLWSNQCICIGDFLYNGHT